MSSSTIFPAVLVIVRVLVAGADEIGWGDVAADGSLTTRSLDVPIATARGTENLFQQDPMASHDWAHTSTVENSLSAQMALVGKSGSSIDSFEEELRPIYSAMPKDAFGTLTNGTARYALHRYFHQKKGWTMKGLQPAGGSWIKSMSVTPDVKEVNKYMLPTYLMDLLLTRTGSPSVDLRSLAILAATLEHLVHGEMIDNLYSVYSTIGLSPAGERSDKEIDEVMDMFMMVYAFGMNLEISTYKDMKKAQHYLESKHSGWPQMQSFVQGVKQKAMRQAGSQTLDFNGILEVLEDVGNEYAKWQNRDCKRAKDVLVAQPTLKDGRVDAKEVTESEAEGYRTLFTEDAETLAKLGVLDDGKLVVPNYINSQSMCLSTASFYTACCVNECEGLIAALEQGAAGPTAEPQKFADLVVALPTLASGDSGQRLEELKTIASEHGGSVPIHSRAVAKLMHRAFPLQCPAPNDMAMTNPKTPDEWMQEPSENIQDTEDMMAEVAAFLAQYTAMGNNMDASETPEEEMARSDEVIALKKEWEQAHQSQSRVSKLCQFVSVLSMLGLAGGALRSGLKATGHDNSKKHVAAKIDCMA